MLIFLKNEILILENMMKLYFTEVQTL